MPGYPHLPSNSGPESEVRRRPGYFFLPGEDMTTNFKFITNFKFNCAAAHCYAHCARPSFWLAPAWAVADVEINADIRLTSSIKRFRFLSIVHYKQTGHCSGWKHKKNTAAHLGGVNFLARDTPLARQANSRGKGSVHPISRMYGGCTARYRTNTVQIPYRRRTDVRRMYASRGYRTDIVRTYGGCTGDVRLDIVQIPYGYRTDITESLPLANRGTARPR